MKVHKGDTVLVISGKDKGAKGKVLVAYPDPQQDPRRGRQPDQEAHPVSRTERGAQSGGIVTQEAPIHVSNVMVLDSDGKPTRVDLPRRRRDRQEGPHRQDQRQGHLR